MTESVVALQSLGFAYRPGKWIFRSYSASVEKGTVLALLGPNGRGKTTLLKLLLGALKPNEGTLTVKGNVAFVPQLFQVAFDYSALEMVLMGRAKKVGLFSQPNEHDREAAHRALGKFGVADLAGRPFHELSGGQRQLVIFARALVAEADILILDEPASSLDVKNQAMVLDWIARLSRYEGLTIIMTTHHPYHALAVADDALLMLGQSEYVTGRANVILTEENIFRLYGVTMKRVGFNVDGQHIESFAPVFARHVTAEL